VTTASEPLVVDRGEWDALLAVAVLYLAAFADDELLSGTEKLQHQQIQAIVAKHGRRY